MFESVGTGSFFVRKKAGLDTHNNFEEYKQGSSGSRQEVGCGLVSVCANTHSEEKGERGVSNEGVQVWRNKYGDGELGGAGCAHCLGG